MRLDSLSLYGRTCAMLIGGCCAIGMSVAVWSTMRAEQGPTTPAQDAAGGWATNRSTPTQCAEEDNVNVPIFAPGARQFEIVASHPTYEIGIDNCQADFTNCPPAEADAPPARPDRCTKLYDDGVFVLETCRMDRWWRNKTMQVTAGGRTAEAHYLRVYQKIAGTSSFVQTAVGYQDSNWRFKGQAPEGRNDVCFGSSVIIGPARPASRPFAEIESVAFARSGHTVEMQVAFVDEGACSMQITADRQSARVSVDTDYPHSEAIPLATFRSMWVSDGNADVDRLLTATEEFPILEWRRAKADSWFFYRAQRSRHNTSAPDIRISIADGR